MESTAQLIPEPSTTSAERRAARSSYIPTFDGWRAVAILIVIIQHAQESFIAAHPSVPFSGFVATMGLYGVRIFFGISGFLITTRILEEIDRRGALSLPAFYVRRAFRILPPLLVLLFAALLLRQAGLIAVGWLEWTSGLLFFANWVPGLHYLGHLWSLGVEEHFYLLWPCLLALLGTKRAVLVALALCPALALWRMVAWHFHLFSTPAVFWGRTDIQLDGLLLGSIGAYVFRYYPAECRRILGHRAAVPLAIGLFMLTCVYRQWDYKISMPLYSLQAVLIPAILIGTIERTQSPLSRVLELAPLKWIGRLSYGLYLWQVFLVPRRTFPQSFALMQAWPYNVACVFLFATVSYYTLELAMVRIGHRLARAVTSKNTDVIEARAATSTRTDTTEARAATSTRTDTTETRTVTSLRTDAAGAPAAPVMPRDAAALPR
ncbi:MAG: acyltransferase [Polyangiaceae bacterium]